MLIKFGEPEPHICTSTTFMYVLPKHPDTDHEKFFENCPYFREVMLSEAAIQKIASKPADGDLPGLGQFHCVACDRHFIDKQALRTHVRTKIHKRRIKKLRDEPYSLKEAEQAAGMGQFTAKTATVSEAILEAATMAACADAADVIRERDASISSHENHSDAMTED
eukprot:m.641067 g.641067  ORF g.641067 m.641067 type:complete len:166 (+) comp22626_c0_seq7:266-763(+)